MHADGQPSQIRFADKVAAIMEGLDQFTWSIRRCTFASVTKMTGVERRTLAAESFPCRPVRHDRGTSAAASASATGGRPFDVEAYAEHHRWSLPQRRRDRVTALDVGPPLQIDRERREWGGKRPLPPIAVSALSGSSDAR